MNSRNPVKSLQTQRFIRRTCFFCPLQPMLSISYPSLFPCWSLPPSTVTHYASASLAFNILNTYLTFSFLAHITPFTNFFILEKCQIHQSSAVSFFLPLEGAGAARPVCLPRWSWYELIVPHLVHTLLLPAYKWKVFTLCVIQAGGTWV